MNHNFLIESALLTHGLAGITNEEMVAEWPDQFDNITWVDRGEIHIGAMKEFLEFRSRSAEVIRIDYETLQSCIDNKISGALTASGTMEVCRRFGYALAVTCGMGGLGHVPGEEFCPDLSALRDIPVALIATSPKDMLDISATIGWLRDHGVRIVGIGTDKCTGYLFVSADVILDDAADCSLGTASCDLIRGRTLMLNPIPEKDRVGDISILEKADETGMKAAADGAYYHPAANNEIDRLSHGLAARIQLRSIIANAKLAAKLTEEQVIQ